MVETSVVEDLRKRIAELESSRDRQQLLKQQEYLEIENERLLQRLEGLQRIIDADPIPRTPLTAQELSLYRVLARHGTGTWEQLAAALHTTSNWGEKQLSDERKHVQVIICRLRRKGATILNLHGVGYQLVKGVP